MGAGVEALAAAMLLQNNAHVEQAERTLAAQRAANQAADERINALSQRIIQLEGQRGEDRAFFQDRVAVLERTVAAQAALIQAQQTQFEAHLRAYRTHTHETDRIKRRGSSPTMIMGRLEVTPGTTSAPQQ